MKFEIVMTDNVKVVHDVDGMELDTFMTRLWLAKGKQGFVILKTKNNTDMAINVDRVITVRGIK